MKTERGLSELLLGDQETLPQVYRWASSDEARRELLAEFSGKYSQIALKSLESEPALKLRPVSVIMDDDNRSADMFTPAEDDAEVLFSDPVQRLIDEGGVPESLMLILLSGSRHSSYDTPIEPFGVLADDFHPDVDYSSFDLEFAVKRVVAAGRYPRGPHANNIISAIHQVNSAMKSESGKAANKIRLGGLLQSTSSKRNRETILIAINTLHGRPDLAARGLVKLISKDLWTVSEQFRKDVDDARHIIQSINDKSD